MIFKFRFIFFSAIFILLFPVITKAQTNAILTAVPGLLINENAQTGGMGEIGTVATEFNFNAAYLQNPALLARNKKVIAGFINYTPLFRSLVPDINLVNIGLLFSPDGKNGFSYAMSYSSLGKITFTSPTGTPLGEYRPFEIYNSLRYARMFSTNFSLGLGYKSIYSKLGPDFMGNDYKGMSHAADIGFNYTSIMPVDEKKDIRLNIGASALNLGPKLTYGFGRYDFVPSVLKIAAMVNINLYLVNKDLITLSFSYQAQKLLVPTPPIRDQNGIVAGTDPDIGVVAGILGSFSDAPGIPIRDANGNFIYNPDNSIQIEKGSVLKEELHEIIHQFGIESRYSFSDIDLALAYRAGYFHEYASKGNRKYITTGVGIQRKAYCIDLAYYISVIARHPMGNTTVFAFSYQLFRQ
ncbi:MAG: PorV/PorQ family protein [Bacteroidetes bacterium]|nr:PorV/PorQ family protein [Bacteroidota bacterium]HET6245007.1 PorV/PorQ family protein [Bacteroidia bacterium]